MTKKKLFLMERQFVFNYAEELSEEDELFDIQNGYTVIFNQDFSGIDDKTISIWDNDGNEVNNPILINEIENKVMDYIYKPQNVNN
jgi:hypothetical protein